MSEEVKDAAAGALGKSLAFVSKQVQPLTPKPEFQNSRFETRKPKTMNLKLETRNP
jgi:hypothetical protein